MTGGLAARQNPTVLAAEFPFSACSQASMLSISFGTIYVLTGEERLGDESGAVPLPGGVWVCVRLHEQLQSPYTGEGTLSDSKQQRPTQLCSTCDLERGHTHVLHYPKEISHQNLIAAL